MLFYVLDFADYRSDIRNKFFHDVCPRARSFERSIVDVKRVATFYKVFDVLLALLIHILCMFIVYSN